MTLLQTRVDDTIAKRFSKAAKQRGMTTYQWLQELVTRAAESSEVEGWDAHWEKLRAFNLKKLPFNAVARSREESGER